MRTRVRAGRTGPRRGAPVLAIVAALPLAIAACDAAGEGNLLEVSADAVVEGVVFFDVNATRDLDGPDRGAAVNVALVLAGTADTVARTQASSEGAFEFGRVPVGRYRIVVPESSLGDSIQVVFRDPPGEPVEDEPIPVEETVLTVGQDDTATVRLGVGYPLVSVAEAKALEEGRRAVVHAVALTRVNEFGDTLLYLEGDDEYMRASRTGAAEVVPGDTVHVSGTRAVREGQPVMRDATAYVIASGGPPAPVPLTAEEANDAGGGVYDGALVTVDDLVIVDTTSVDDDERLLVEAADETGTLEILIHQDGSFDFDEYAPDAVLEVTGILAPADEDGAVWQLRPRSAEDVEITPPPAEEAGVATRSATSRVR